MFVSMNQPVSVNQTIVIAKQQSKVPVKSAKQSLMSMMKQIMQKSFLNHNQLHYIAEQSHQCSQSTIVLEDKFQQPNFKSTSTNPLTNQSTPLNNKTHETHSLESQANESPKVSSKQEFADSSVSSTSSEFDKLIQITSRCVQYYNKFLGQKSLEFEIIDKTFTDLTQSLDSAFDEIISEAKKKQHQLKQFLTKKYNQILHFKNSQDQKLKYTLEQIKSIHLANLLSKNQQNTNKSTSIKNEFIPHEKNSQLSFELHNYALTLNTFYGQMQDIEKSNFKQMVQESVNFISNLITEQIKSVLNEKIPARLAEKRIVRQNSKDFLMDSNQNSMVDFKNSNMNILDIDSFTKLFLETDNRNPQDFQLIQGDINLEKQTNMKNSNINSQIPLEIKSQNHQKSQSLRPERNSKTNIRINLNQQTVITPQFEICGIIKNTSEQKQNFRKKIASKNNQVSSNANQVNQSMLKSKNSQTQLSTSRSRKFIKGSTVKVLQDNAKVVSPIKTQVVQIQNNTEIDLIKKISNQQTSRSAKIKGYLVNFQQSQANQKTQQPTLSKRGSIAHHKPSTSQSPNRVSRTPPKLNKSTEKKPSVVNNSSIQQKLKSSQQYETSLKSSRTYGQVSEFKISLSRRQSVGLK